MSPRKPTKPEKVVQRCPQCGLKVRGELKDYVFPVRRQEFVPDPHTCKPGGL
jgi:hypothetical protein